MSSYGALEVEQVYACVRSLCQQIEASPQLFPVLIGVAAFHIVRAKYRIAAELGEQVLRRAQREQEPSLLVEAHAFMGIVLFYLGEFGPARAQFEQSMALYDPQHHRSHAMLYGQDPWVFCRTFLSWTLWILGYPVQALQGSHAAIAYAQELNHPMSLAFALGLSAILHNMRCESEAGRERAEAVIAIAAEHGLPYWLAEGTFVRGQALMQGENFAEGLAQIRQVAQAFRGEGRARGRPARLVILARVYLETGQPEQGRQALADAHAAALSGGERYWEAEVYRLKGELLLALQSSRNR